MASKDMSEVLGPVALGAQGVGAAFTASGAYTKAVADKTAYGVQADVADQNAVIARAQASDAITRGQTATFNSQLRTRQIKGQQIAAMAANGLDLSEGTPLNILTDTEFMGQNDANVLARNAIKEAYGFSVSAANAKSNADLLRYRADMESPGKAAAASLLTSAGSVASKWYSMRHPYADMG